jgi:TetR/AcrR family transcriptional regulator, transcriptional repressor for nem operon
MNKQDTKQTLLNVGTDLIFRKGYNHTGLNEVLEVAEVPKGSFYYYFDNKEDFALQALDQFAARHKVRREGFLHDETLPPLSRLRAFFDWYIGELESVAYIQGCPLGNLGQELSNQNETMRLHISETMSVVANDVAQCLLAAQQAGEINPVLDVQELAAFIYNSWQGAMLRMKITKSAGPLKIFLNTLFNVILK